MSMGMLLELEGQVFDQSRCIDALELEKGV